MLASLTERFRNELDPGERLIWSGQPQQGFLLSLSDALMIPFSLIWCGFACFWEYEALNGGAPILFMLWGIPFLLVGLYLIFGRFLFDMDRRRRTYYALTNRRAIIISEFFGRNVKSLELSLLPEINIYVRDNGKGTILFGPIHPMGWMATNSGLPVSRRYPVSPSFEMIEDVRTVYRNIQEIRRSRSSLSDPFS